MTCHSPKRVFKASVVVLLGPVVGILLALLVLLLVQPGDGPIRQGLFILWYIGGGVVLGTVTSCVLAIGVWQRGTAFPISRNGRVILIFLVVVAAAVVGGWTGWNWKLLRPYHWQMVESPDATFRVSFPGSPKTSTQNETDVIDGRQFLSNRLTASPAPRIGYAVSWWDNPEQNDKSTAELFEHFRDCNAKTFGGKVATKELTVAGHPAIDIVTVNAEGTVAHNRVIRVGSRIYSLWVIDGSGRFAVDMKNINKFFGSFSLY